jgi:RPA family protein
MNISMKLKYLFAACVACLGLAVACEDDPQYVLEELQVDKSYVAIPMDGGSDEITVTSGQSWSFDETLIPDWLTVSPTSGSNGETTVTFTASETKVGRDVELKINVGDQEQYVKVMQGLKVATTSTCAEVIAGEDGVLYRVTGTCTGISNTTYGNWFLQDSTGEIYIYGTLDSQGAEKNFSSLGIEVGDVVTVEGPKSTYNGTVELVDVTVISIVKSLLQIDPSDIQLEYPDTSLTVKAVVSDGSTFSWALGDDSDWMQITATSEVEDTVFVTLHVDENEDASSRTGSVTFSASNGSQTTTQTLTVYQGVNTEKFLAGTIRKPYIVAQAIAAIDAGQIVETYYVAGIIRQIDDVSTTYGNATYWIADNDSTETLFEVYRGKYLDGAKFTSADQIEVGDQVVISGKLTKYNDTYELGSGSSLVTINGLANASGDGTADNPYNVAAVVDLLNAGTAPADAVYIKGYVSSDPGISTTYGNATYWIADSGADAKVFEVYRGLYFGGESFTSLDQLSQNDEVVVQGILTSYTNSSGVTTLETKAGSILISRNGDTE